MAKNVYEALMKGDNMVVSGFKTKMQVAAANITPDSMVADNTKKIQEPVGNESSRNIAHKE